MGLVTLKHGSILDTVSRAEMEALLRDYTTRQETRERVRASATIILDATGAGQDEVYAVPTGFEAEIRRVLIDLSTATEATLVANSINLSLAGVAVQYLRSGTRIEWALPTSPLGGARVPGVETWGSQQGPYLRNGETFEVRALLGAATANATLTVTVEGILMKAGSLK